MACGTAGNCRYHLSCGVCPAIGIQCVQSACLMNCVLASNMDLIDYDSEDEEIDGTASNESAGDTAVCTCSAPATLKFLPVQGDWPCLIYCSGMSP